MVDWNNTLSQNHPDIDPSVFKKRILDLFKRAVSGLMTNKLYKQALLSIDELIETTAEPSEYKEELYGYVEELLMQKDNSWSMKIGHAVTKPVKVMLQLKGKLFRST
jgi:hypothetical protein